MHLYTRTHQQIYRLAAYIQKWKTQVILSGENVYENIIDVLDKDKTVFIVSDKNIKKLHLMEQLLHQLEAQNCKYIVYDKVEPNPTIDNIEDALKLYNDSECYNIIAFGGGSPMDCAKIVSARAVKPNQSVKKMRGLLKIKKTPIPIIAIPTTAGTGSETTIVAVITDNSTHEKYSILDMCLTPPYVALIPELTNSLPQAIIATTGLDALTHAIEAFIGKSNTYATCIYALDAIKLIHQNLLNAYSNKDDHQAHEAMLYASFFAGKAFTRAYVGNVHALTPSL